MREYVTMKPKADLDWDEVRSTDYLARVVFEDVELIDTGIRDSDGNKIMARKRPDPVGYVRFK